MCVFVLQKRNLERVHETKHVSLVAKEFRLSILRADSFYQPKSAKVQFVETIRLTKSFKIFLSRLPSWRLDVKTYRGHVILEKKHVPSYIRSVT